MAYIDGFVIPVAPEQRAAFIDHANKVDAYFLELGALRVVECWQDDVPTGQRTDLFRAVDAQPGEAVAFSWIEWPDKATRDAAYAKFSENAELMAIPMPFDGKRMIFGGFTPVVTLEG